MNKMNLTSGIFFILFSFSFGFSQSSEQLISNLSEISNTEAGLHYYWLEMGSNTFGQPITVPVIVVQGKSLGPTLGLTAAIHGNELNGIPIIHQLIETINVNTLNGRIIAIPGLNPISIEANQRRFIDSEDLNRNIPGKEFGNRSQQFSFKIKERILSAFNYHIDMHTASFGRTNSLYVRADMANDTLRQLASLQQADIILNSKSPSFGSTSKSTRTLRAEAAIKGIPSITVEYGNPQVFQNDLTLRGLKGIYNTLKWLQMYNGTIEKPSEEAVLCTKSYWIYLHEGGFLEVPVQLKEQIKKGELIGIVRNAFGKIINQYYAPENGIVIGKSTNPVNISGGRIIHLGIVK